MSFSIEWFPNCTHHVFLSHTGLDKADLILPVRDRIIASGVVPWIDQDDYNYGRDSFLALSEGILACRHVVFFITPAMMANPKGWCPVELGFADIIERNLCDKATPLVNVILPLIFLPNAREALPGTVWRTLWDSGTPHDPDRHPDRVSWAAESICRFLEGEQRRAEQFDRRRIKDKAFGKLLNAKPGLQERVTTFEPQPLPSQ
jgi:TIR domain